MSPEKNVGSNVKAIIFAFLGIIFIMSYFFMVSNSPLVEFMAPQVPSTEIQIAADTFFKELPSKNTNAKKHVKALIDKNLLKFSQFFKLQNNKFPDLSIGYWEISWTGDGEVNQEEERTLFRVKYDFTGRLMGFFIRSNILAENKIKNLNEDDAILEAKFFLEAQGIKTEYLVISNKDISKKEARVKYSIKFKNNLRQYPGLEETFTVELTGDQVTFFDHKKQYDPGITGDLDRDPSNGIAVIMQIVIWIFVIAVIIIHFIRRLRNDELEFKRALGIGTTAGIIAFFLIPLKVSSDLPSILLAGGALAIFSAIAFLVIFPVSEAHCRDVWPEKLSLTDLLFRGKGMLREMGISILRSFFLVGLILFFIGVLILVSTTFNLGRIDFDSQSLSVFLDFSEAFYILQKNLLLCLFAGFVFLAFWPAYLKIRVSNYTITLILLLLSFNIAGLYTLFFQPSYLAFLFFTPVALAFAAISIKYDILTTILVFFGVSLFLDLVLIMVIPDSLFGFPGMTAIIFYFLFLLLGIYLSFSRRSVHDYDHYIPSYVSRIAEKERFFKELEIARSVQMRFLPQTVPNSPNLEIVSLCRPAMEVGGDYYDFIQIDENRMIILIGDVSGKGVSAAFYMTMIKGIIKTLAKKIETPAQLLCEANEIFFENAPRDTFITLLFGIFDMKRRLLTFASAGHNPLIVWRKKQGKTELFNPRGIAIGFLHNPSPGKGIEEESITFDEGDLFVFYTDGVTEAMNGENEIFGEKRLKDVISQYHHLPPSQLEHRIVEAVSRFSGNSPQHDDFTMVIVKIKPTRQAAKPPGG